MPDKNLAHKITDSIAFHLLEASIKREFPDIPPLLRMLVDEAIVDTRLPAGYQEHMDSESWRLYRVAVLRLMPCCIVCFDDDDLHVHHLTYRRFKQERLSDCVPLCYRCHAWVHQNGSMPVKWMEWTYPELAGAVGLGLLTCLSESGGAE